RAWQRPACSAKGAHHMDFTSVETAAFDRLLALALEEDLGTNGDLTSRALRLDTLDGAAVLVARAPGVIAGLKGAQKVFVDIDSELEFTPHLSDGATLS